MIAVKLVTKQIVRDDAREVRELSDEELMHVVGGVQLGKPMCPRCYNKKVVIDARIGAVSYCKACGYEA